MIADVLPYAITGIAVTLAIVVGVLAALMIRDNISRRRTTAR